MLVGTPMVAAQRIRILLVEDHRSVREGLRIMLNSHRDFEVVAEADDGQSAIDRVRELMPEVVLMDLSMPGMNGLLATRTILASWPAARICVLTRHNDEAHLFELLQAGVLGYVLKQSVAAELVAAIRAVAAGREYVDDAMTSRMTRGYRIARAQQPGRATGLSARENEVLRHTAWGRSNKEIAAEIGLSVKTIESHKANAMRKLGFNSRLDIVRYAVLKGWLEE